MPEKIGRRLYEFTLASGKRSYRCDLELNGRQVRKTLKARNRTAARKEQAALIAQHARGEVVASTRRNVEEVVEEFLASFSRSVASGERSARTLESYSWRLRSRVISEIGTYRFQTLTADDAARLIAGWRERGDSAWTIRSTLTALSRVIRFGLRRGYIADDPLRRLEAGEKPSVGKKDHRVLAPEEIARLVRAAAPGARPLIATLAMTGLRQGEALGLTWENVDFEAGVVRVRTQLARGTSEGGAKLKTSAANRDVVLVPGLAATLREHKAAMFANGRAKPEDFVFSTSSGRPLNHRNASRSLGRAVELAGLGEGISTHSLRHTFVSFLILELGWDAVRVARQVGHTNPSFTMDVYAHVFENGAGHADALRDKIAASAFGKVLS